MTDAQRMRPFFKLFGSKWQLSRHYPPPKHDVIVEPFAGSACYALRYPERRVVLVERDKRIASLWRWLIHSATPDEILALPCEELLPGTDLRTLGLRLEAVELIARWQRVGNNTCYAVSKWNCANSGMWHPSTRASIAANLHRIRHWSVSSADALTEVCYTRRPCTWFVDPPYQRIPWVYDGLPPNYAQLADWCRRRRGQVIVCEQQGADWLPFEPFRTLSGMSDRTRKTSKRSHEVLWYRE